MHEGFTIGLSLHEGSFPVVVIDNFVSKEDYPHVKEEINYLSKFAMGTPQDAGAATNADGSQKKVGKSLWFREFYGMPRFSPTIQAYVKLLGNLDVRKKIMDYHPEMYWWGKASHDNQGGFILNKYEDGDYYDFHYDSAMYTVLSYFQDEPKNYDGGELVIEYPNLAKDKQMFEIKDNRAIIFPSHYMHSVLPIKYNSEASTPRFSVAAFVRHLT